MDGKAGPAAGPEDEWEELSAAETERVLAEAAKRDAAAAAASSGASAEDDEAPEWAKDAEPQHKRGRKSKASRQQPAAPEKDADDKKQASSVAAFGNRRLTDPNDVFSHNAWDQVEWGEEQAQAADAVVAQHRAVEVPPERTEEHERKAADYWDRFYGIHQNKFFKDRNWLRIEFPELFAIPEAAEKFTVLEVGCGAGNTVFPLLTQQPDPRLFVYACDFAPSAVNIVRTSPLYDPQRCHAFICDLANDALDPPVAPGSLDVIVMIFVLSAIRPDAMPRVMKKLFEARTPALQPGGMLLFRDYGRYDLAQLRFREKNVLGENFYARGDGTRVYFFTEDELRKLAEDAGFVVEQNTSDRRLIVNRTRRLQMYRIWQQGKYRRPAAPPAAQ